MVGGMGKGGTGRGSGRKGEREMGDRGRKVGIWERKVKAKGNR